MAAAVSFQAAVAKATGTARPARRSVKVQVRGVRATIDAPRVPGAMRH